MVVEQMNDSNDASQHAERQAESLVEDVGVDDRLIEEYNACTNWNKKNLKLDVTKLRLNN